MAIKSISDLARVHGVERRDKVALRAGDRTFTYGELNERTSRVANALRAEGVEEQDRVAFLDKNGPEYFDVLFGGAKANAVDVAVNWRLAPPEVAYIVNDSQSKVFFVGEEFVPVLDAIEGDLTTVKKVIVVGSHPTSRVVRGLDRPPRRHRSRRAGGPDDVALQFYTSGTTGLPKGVMLTNPNLFTAMDALSTQLEFTPESVNLVAMPLFHIGGGGWACVGLTAGCEDVIVREVDPVAIVEDDRRATGHPRVPGARRCSSSCCMMPDAANADFSTLRDDRLRRVADHDAGAEGFAPSVRVWLHAGLRADRDDGRGHRLVPRRARSRRAHLAPVALGGQAAQRRRASHRRLVHRR